MTAKGLLQSNLGTLLIPDAMQHYMSRQLLCYEFIKIHYLGTFQLDQYPSNLIRCRQYNYTISLVVDIVLVSVGQWRCFQGQLSYTLSRRFEQLRMTGKSFRMGCSFCIVQKKIRLTLIPPVFVQDINAWRVMLKPSWFP